MLKLIKEFKEGLKIYKCLACGHTIHKSKQVKDKDFKCIYCGGNI